MKEMITIGVECCFYLVVCLVAFSDWKKRRIPNGYVLVVLLLGILSLYGNREIWMGQRIWGSVIGSVPMFLLTMCTPGSFGGGDIKITFAYGFFLGIDDLLQVLCIGSVVALLWAFTRKSMKQKDWKEIPLGVFLAVGIFGNVFL